MKNKGNKFKRVTKSTLKLQVDAAIGDPKMPVPPRSSVEPHVPAYIGFVERISSGVIEGWAIDRLDLSRRPSVRAMVDGQVIGTGISDIYQEHVHKSGAGDGRYGFRIACNDMAIPLERISVVIDDPAHPFRLPLTKRAMTEMRASNTPAYIGIVELIAPGLIEGWALDRHDLGRHLRVTAKTGGQVLGSAICDLYREHLHKSGAGDGRYGFQITFEDTATVDDIAVVVDDQRGTYNLAFTPEASTALRQLEPATPAGVSPAIAPENEVTPDPSDAAMAGLEARVQTLQAELGHFKSALAQSIEKWMRHSAEVEALAPLREELRDASPIPPEQVPWGARGIYQQLLRKLSASI